MRHLKISDDKSVRIVTLARPKANAMHHDMVVELASAIRDSRDDDTVRGLVIASAQPRFFSTGFDVGEVFAYDRKTMREFFSMFLDLCDEIRSFPKPVVAALSGHTFAGGAFLALACDMRVMGAGDWGFAVNEINFGAILPPAIRRMAIQIVGPQEARRMFLTGDAVAPSRALEIGLADDLVREEDALSKALEWAHRLASKPPAAFRYTKRALASDLDRSRDTEDPHSIELFLDHWFSAESVNRRSALAATVRG